MILPTVPNVTILALEAFTQLWVPFRHNSVTDEGAANAGLVRAPWQRVCVSKKLRLPPKTVFEQTSNAMVRGGLQIEHVESEQFH